MQYILLLNHNGEIVFMIVDAVNESDAFNQSLAFGNQSFFNVIPVDSLEHDDLETYKSITRVYPSNFE